MKMPGHAFPREMEAPRLPVLLSDRHHRRLGDV